MAYSVKEVALKTGIPAYMLHFYEKEGLLPAVKRNANGSRLYEDDHLKWLDFILALLSTGMPLADVKHYVELSNEGGGTMHERRQIMLSHKATVEKQMMQLLKCVEKINNRLASYDALEKEMSPLPDERKNQKLR